MHRQMHFSLSLLRTALLPAETNSYFSHSYICKYIYLLTQDPSGRAHVLLWKNNPPRCLQPGYSHVTAVLQTCRESSLGSSQNHLLIRTHARWLRTHARCARMHAALCRLTTLSLTDIAHRALAHTQQPLHDGAPQTSFRHVRCCQSAVLSCARSRPPSGRDRGELWRLL